MKEKCGGCKKSLLKKVEKFLDKVGKSIGKYFYIYMGDDGGSIVIKYLSVASQLQDI